MSARRIVTSALILLACGCATAYDEARRSDTPEAWREFLRENPEDPETRAARARLGELEFLEARRQHSLIAYKRFLSAYSDSPRAKDAAMLIEGLRFEAATAADTSSAWREFLRDHPAGAHASEAKAKLMEADFRAAAAATDAKSIEEFLGRHPASKRREEALGLLDERLFAEARAAGPRGLAGYLEKSTEGRFREEARALLGERDALARAQMGDFAGARRRAELVADPAARERVAAEIDRRELEWASASLDPRALNAFALLRGGPLAEEAKRRARTLGGERGPSAEIAAAAARLDPAHYARPEEDLLRVLAAPDPRDRWLAVEELGRIGSQAAVEPLLEAMATSRFTKVRVAAFEALRAIFSLLPADALELEVRARIEGLRQVAEGPQLQIKLAVLSELTGEARAAAGAYEKALRADPTDLFALRRFAVVRAALGEHFGSGVVARELATRVLQLAEQRSGEEGLSPLLLSRTLCGARDDARAAGDALRAIPEAVAKDFTEDHVLFLRRAAEALRVAGARLSDAEAKARWADRNFLGCDDDGELRARLDQGDAERLKAVTELAAKGDPRLRPALERVALRDPSGKVREAARAALAATAKGE